MVDLCYNLKQEVNTLGKMSAKDLAINAVFTAFVLISTIILQIPVPAANGYIHMGDGIILICAVFFGKRTAMFAGGLGSLLADVLTGYAHWALFSLVIKGAMGFLCGVLSEKTSQEQIGEIKLASLKNVVAVFSGAFFMVVGYFFAGIFLLGGISASVASVLPNVLQGGFGILVYFIIGTVLRAAFKAQKNN